ncbi:MAG TPA: CvpA family protein [Mollicutes bacterium]|nr:CvpA family protein [Mollicutes bacterium]
MGAAVGFARGFLRQTVKSIGGILVIVFSFIFRGPVALFLIKILPTFNFKGIFNGISSLNILVYEVIAFIILLMLFGIVMKFLFALATFIERILNATIFLAIPSKILGAILGLAEAYLIVFVILFILTLPVFNIRIINESKYKDKILEGTPIVSKLAKKTIESFDDIYALKDELSKGADRLQLDKKILKILIDNNIISSERADELYEKGKINTR